MDLKKNKAIIIILISLLIVIWVGFNYRNLSGLDIYKISTRRGYYPKIVSRLFQNKLTESLYITRKQIYGFFKL